jgi:cytochrome P450
MVPSDPIAAVTHPDPYPYYAELVAHRPFSYDRALDLWVAASAEAVTAVLSGDACRVRPPSEPVPRSLLGSAAADIFGALVRMNDRSAHCPLKRAVSAVFDSIDLSEAASRSWDWAGRLVDELRPHHDRGRLMELAFRLPVYVVADLLGVPHDQMPRIARQVEEFVGCLAPSSTAEQIGRGKVAASQLREMLQALLDPHQSGPISGLLTTFAEETRHAGCDDPSVIVSNGIGFLSQSYEATAGLIGNTLVTLAREPKLLAQVLDDLSLLAHILAEVLRYDPPIQNTRRFLAQDGMVAGQALRAGDIVLVLVAAANRDGAANEYPQRFDPFRSERRVFTFGVGVHTCPGAALATTIAQAGVAQLLASGLNLASLMESVSYRPSANARIPMWKESAR